MAENWAVRRPTAQAANKGHHHHVSHEEKNALIPRNYGESQRVDTLRTTDFGRERLRHMQARACHVHMTTDPEFLCVASSAALRRPAARRSIATQDRRTSARNTESNSLPISAQVRDYNETFLADQQSGKRRKHHHELHHEHEHHSKDASAPTTKTAAKKKKAAPAK